MTYFAQVLDGWDCELDFIGPFNTQEDAERAAWDKWDGDEHMNSVVIVKRPHATLC